jgi:molecular chaperone IbpA
MRAYDFSPFYRTTNGRSTLGFDRVTNMLDNLVDIDQSKSNYPPYNIEQKSDDQFRITLAVAGFEQNELTIESEQNRLTVSGKKEDSDVAVDYLHRGIATRNFERRYQLADHVRVAGAAYRNGLLYIELVRELPEVMKPRTIQIATESELGNIANAAKAVNVDKVEGASNQQNAA